MLLSFRFAFVCESSYEAWLSQRKKKRNEAKIRHRPVLLKTSFTRFSILMYHARRASATGLGSLHYIQAGAASEAASLPGTGAAT